MALGRSMSTTPRPVPRVTPLPSSSVAAPENGTRQVAVTCGPQRVPAAPLATANPRPLLAPTAPPAPPSVSSRLGESTDKAHSVLTSSRSPSLYSA